MHTLWITPACCLPHTISRSPNASQKWHHYLHFTRAVGLLKQNKVPEHHSGKMDAFGRVFVLLCFPCMSTGHVLAVKAWPPDVQKFLTKVQCLFFSPAQANFPVGNWCHSQGKPNIWKFHILQTGNTRGTKGHPPGWGESQGYNPHFLTSEAVLNPLNPLVLLYAHYISSTLSMVFKRT